MSTWSRRLRRTWSRLPGSVRHRPAVQRLKSKVIGHDTLYSDDYYAAAVEPAAQRSAGPIAASIVDEFSPGSVLDVGCGTGALLAALRDRGCTVAGLEYSEAALELCRRRDLDVQKFDLERDATRPEDTYDVVTSMEVAEHLPKSAADRYVDLLTAAAPVVVFTAAPPGQHGTDHVNLQLPPYWHEKFARHGFRLDPGVTSRWREVWGQSGEVEWWYTDNLMVFRRA